MKPFRHAMLAGMIREVLLEIERLSVAEEKQKAKDDMISLLNYAKSTLEDEKAKKPLETAWYFVRTSKLISDRFRLKVDVLDSLDHSPQLFGQ